ncbi:MAG: hypothetical protein KC609_17080, partial [Myxococcales bacterium]|nr:hypothetical protein [Myxococcales bacterium]
MSERDAGICPLCEQRGEIGAACGHNAICQKRELHFIPLEYFDRLRDTKPNDRPAYIGETIDDYLLVGLLGEGGFGQVYRALQLPLLMPAAMKLL